MKIFRIVDNQCLYSIVCATTEKEAKQVFLNSYCPPDIYTKKEQEKCWQENNITIYECDTSKPNLLLLTNS